MKISFYDRDGRFTGTSYEVKNPKFVGETIVTETGMVFGGLTELNFILLNDNEEPLETFAEAKKRCKSGTLEKLPTKAGEIAELKKQIRELQEALKKMA